MRASRLLLATLREPPAEAETASHRLLLRAGMIRQLAAGIYTWLPLGWRVLKKIEGIVRAEMDRIGCQEILMPAVQPAELWRESGRWEEYGPELLRFQDRHSRDFCLGPTHEEVVTDLARRELRSYKRLPLVLYQIQTKFRDEVRPRFGILRGREFLMKDAYSFHLDEDCLDRTYARMRESYGRILDRLGMEYRVVAADSGNIGGALSHEFHVLVGSGEDRVAFSDSGDYAANVELVAAPPPAGGRPPPGEDKRAVETPDCRTIAEVSRRLGLPPERCLKTLVVKGAEDRLLALILRGDHELNRLKAERCPGVASPLRFAAAEEIRAATGCMPGSLGPAGLPLPLLADREAAVVADFACGANREGAHFVGVNWGRDLPEPETADLRNVADGDASPQGGGRLRVSPSMEVGHIFKLGDKYSAAMNAVCLNREGKAQPLVMGCYGMGVSRLVAAVVEQRHDEAGIVWPVAVAPCALVLIPIHMHRSRRLQRAVEGLYRELLALGIDVLLDDRRERPGVMYRDAELIGIPHWLVLGDSGLDRERIEYRRRGRPGTRELPLAEAAEFCRRQLAVPRAAPAPEDAAAAPPPQPGGDT